MRRRKRWPIHHAEGKWWRWLWWEEWRRL